MLRRNSTPTGSPIGVKIWPIMSIPAGDPTPVSSLLSQLTRILPLASCVMRGRLWVLVVVRLTVNSFSHVSGVRGIMCSFQYVMV